MSSGAGLLDQPAELGETGLRGERGGLAVGAQHAEEPAHLGQRLAGGGLDGGRSSASRAWSGPSRRRTAWVWMVTTLIEWDTMSCSSRAMRVRSSWATRAASSLALALEPIGPGDGLVGAVGAVAGDARRPSTDRRRTPAPAARSLNSKSSGMMTADERHEHERQAERTSCGGRVS